MNCKDCPHKIYHEKHKERDRGYSARHRVEVRKQKMKSYYKNRAKILAKMRLQYKKTGVWGE
jgi:hypothetical protein